MARERERLCCPRSLKSWKFSLSSVSEEIQTRYGVARLNLSFPMNVDQSPEELEYGRRTRRCRWKRHRRKSPRSRPNGNRTYSHLQFSSRFLHRGRNQGSRSHDACCIVIPVKEQLADLRGGTAFHCS